jgi:hypothetical protein
MGIRVIISFEGIDEVIGDIEGWGEHIETNIEEAMAELATDTQEAWQEATPRRTGRLQEGDKATPEGMSFTLANPVYYYGWRNDGHATPRGWRTRHGYRPAKKHSFVKGARMSEAAIHFVRGELMQRLGKAVSSA